jgi:hypothetical protein
LGAAQRREQRIADLRGEPGGAGEMAEAGEMLCRALAEQDHRQGEFGDHHQREGEQTHREPWRDPRWDGEAPHAPTCGDPARREHHR